MIKYVVEWTNPITNFCYDKEFDTQEEAINFYLKQTGEHLVIS